MGRNLKINLKVLVALAIILGAILIFTPNKVEANQYATIMSGTVTEEALDNMSDTIKVDLKESEFAKVPEIIMGQVTEKLEEQGIVIGKTYDNSIGSLYVGFQERETYTPRSDVAWTTMNCDIRNVFVSINIYSTSTTNSITVTKRLAIEYNNTNNYTEANKNYVANLVKDIDETYIDAYCNVNTASDGWNASEQVIDELNKKINDASIKFIWNGGTGDFEEQDLDYDVFKDDVYYQSIGIKSKVYCVTEDVKVGNNITVDGLIDGTNIEVENKENTEMVTEVSKNGYNKIIGSYELKLTGATSLVKPIDVTFDVGTEYNGKMAYILHKKASGSYEKFEETIQNGKVTITVSELSPFVIAVKEGTETTPITNNEETETTPTTNTGEKDTTPKTATIDIIGYVLVTTILSGVGIVVLKKRF